MYFGLWSLMKSPLLLSSKLSTLVPELLSIINNTEVIAVNQDEAGVQARKLVVDGKPLPWLVGLTPCDSTPHTFYSRTLERKGVLDPKQWSVTPANTKGEYTIKSLSTGRCLELTTPPPPPPSRDDCRVQHQVGDMVGLAAPCDASDVLQRWSLNNRTGELASKVDGLCLLPSEALALGHCEQSVGLTAAAPWMEKHFATGTMLRAGADCLQVFDYTGPDLRFCGCKNASDVGPRGAQNELWAYDATTGMVKNLATAACCGSVARPIPSQGMCLSRGKPATAPGGVSKRRVVLMPCDASSAAQGWGFGKGLHSPSSMCVIS